MDLNTAQLIALPFVLGLVLLFIPILAVRVFFHLPTWIKIKDWHKLATETSLKYVGRVKIGYFSHIGVSVLSLVAGYYNNERLCAFSVVPYYHRAGRIRYTWVNGIFHRTLSADELDLVIKDSSYKQLVPKGIKFYDYTIPVGVSTWEFVMMLSGIIFIKHDVFIPFETAKDLWLVGRKYYVSKASFKQTYFTKDNSAEDIRLIYNSNESYDYYVSTLKKRVDVKIMKTFFDTYQEFINQTGKTVPVDLDSLVGGF